MPWNPDGTRKKASAYKMKGYSYPGTSPVKELTNEEKLDNLRNQKENYKTLSKEEKERFNEAWKRYGGKTYEIPKP